MEKWSTNHAAEWTAAQTRVGCVNPSTRKTAAQPSSTRHPNSSTSALTSLVGQSNREPIPPSAPASAPSFLIASLPRNFFLGFLPCLVLVHIIPRIPYIYTLHDVSTHASPETLHHAAASSRRCCRRHQGETHVYQPAFTMSETMRAIGLSCSSRPPHASVVVVHHAVAQ